MPRGTYGNGKPKASKGRAKTRAMRKLWKRGLGTQSLSPGKLAGIVTQRKYVSKAVRPTIVKPTIVKPTIVKPTIVKPIRSRPAKSKISVKKMILWTAGSKRKTGERGVR
mgnify:CR=1 FL=1